MTQAKIKLQPEQWAIVLNAVEALIDAAPEERSTRLSALVDGDPALVRIVLEMLALESGSSAGGAIALDASAAAFSSASAPFAAWGSIPREEVGPYRLHREIGRGGMGQVFLASRSDGAIDRRVALKLVHPGLGSKEVIARFERERQVQASLIHPGIAVLLDGGATEDGLPYLVMEYVDGQRLDEWCDGRRLSLTARLALFVKVAEAVAYAHGSRVIHRDLKPSNILVTAEGHPKLLDFGIAKVLDGGVNALETLTVEGMQRMTPAYASPEQLRGSEVTVATDIYSLGTLLFELLTGHPPHVLDGCSVAEIERSVCEESPRRPSRAVLEELEVRGADSGATTRTIDALELGRRRQSTPSALRREIQGDLERVVMKCLRKEPNRRYASVDGLIADLERFRDGRTILARPESLIYRARTFVHRHWVGVAAATTVLAALSGALVFSLMQYSRAVESGHIATEKGLLAEQRLSSLMDFRWDVLHKVASSVNETPGAMDARERIIQAVMDCLERETATLDGDAPRMEELIDSYISLANLQGHPRAMNRGRLDAAEKTLLEARAISTQLLAAYPGKARAAWLQARVDVAFGSLLASGGDYAGAEFYLSGAIELCRGAMVELDFERRDRLFYLHFESLGELSYLAMHRGELALAREYALQSKEVLAELIVEYPDQGYFLAGDREATQTLLAEIANRGGNFEMALGLVEPARKRLGEMMASHGENAAAQRMNGTMLSVLASSYAGLGKIDLGRAAMEAAVEVAQASAEASAGDIRALETLVARYLDAGEFYLGLGLKGEAEASYAHAREVAAKNVESRQGRYPNSLRKIDVDSGLARSLNGRGHAAEVIELVNSASAQLDHLIGEHGERFELKRRRARLEWTLGEALGLEPSVPTEPGASLDRLEAIEHLEAALAMSQALLDEGLRGSIPEDTVEKIRTQLEELRARAD